jgi:hypothetical protein
MISRSDAIGILEKKKRKKNKKNKKKTWKLSNGNL